MGLDLLKTKLPVVILLVTLAASAFFLAKGTTSLVAGKVFPQSAEPPGGAGAGPAAVPPGAEPPDPKSILARNAFDPTTGPLWPPPKELELPDLPEDEGTSEELAPGELPADCEGKVRLIASVYAEDMPDWSFATLAGSDGPPLLYRKGGVVDDLEVVEIYPSAVLMQPKDGKPCALTLFRAKEQATAKAKKPDKGKEPAKPAAAPTGTALQGGISQDDLDKGIQKTSDTKYTVQRSLVDKVLENQAEIMRSARIVPFEQNGQVLGVKLYGIRRNSLLGSLGLQNGDLLRTINGYDMSSPDSALEAYSRLRSAANLSLSVTRRGQATTLDYQIQQ